MCEHLTMQRSRMKVYFCEEINGHFSSFPLYSKFFNNGHKSHEMLLQWERTFQDPEDQVPLQSLLHTRCGRSAGSKHTHLPASRSVSSVTRRWGRWCYSECCSSCPQWPECCRGQGYPSLQRYSLPGQSCHIFRRLRKS